MRSSGPGGQHVNKTSTKVVLNWDLKNSSVFDEETKSRLFSRLANRLTKNGVLILHNDQSRSQHANKEAVQKQFINLVEKGLRRQKKRKKKRISKSAKLKRLSNKKHQAEKKATRKPPKL